MAAAIAASGRLRQAVGVSASLSRENILNGVFAWLFRGLVYPQIWEDPEVDLEALELTADCHLAVIASGGCNVLSYLTGDPARITALDLNTAHIALNKLKIAAALHLPGWPDFFRFFGAADTRANITAYERHIRPHLDETTRAYWERRRFGFGRQRISAFARNFYRYGLLGRCIGFGHLVARCYGVNPRGLLSAKTIDEQRDYFSQTIAPLLERPLIRWALARRYSLFGLGIPPAQHAALASAGGGDIAAVVYDRLERLACGFDLSRNYFAWQAFGRNYAREIDSALPPYLASRHFDTVRARVDRVEVRNQSFTEYLESREAATLDRYVLLDAQDWMSDAQLDALWSEITRTAKPGARVIFRTAAAPSLLPGRVDESVLARWHYQADRSLDLSRRDRSAIYGGFHLYVLR